MKFLHLCMHEERACLDFGWACDNRDLVAVDLCAGNIVLIELGLFA